MAGWTGDELSKIGAAEELEIATVRTDGTLRRPVTEKGLSPPQAAGLQPLW